MQMPNPEPLSGNCDVVRIWDGNPQSEQTAAPVEAQQQPSPAAQAPSAPTSNAVQPAAAPTPPVSVPQAVGAPTQAATTPAGSAQ